MEEKDAGERNSAYARKGILLRCACYRYTVRSPNALRATVESGFRIARYALRVVTCAPVEYLTYEIRDAFRYQELRRGRCPHRPASLIESVGADDPVRPVFRYCNDYRYFEGR